MRIGLDIDGVVYPWHYSIYRYFIENRNFVGTEREFWSYFKTLSNEWQDYFVSIPICYLDQTPTADVMEYLPKIAQLGEITYITSRHLDLQWATRKFFNIYDLPFKENIIFSKNKAIYARLNQLDVFLDDFPANVDSLQGITNVYLFKAPHNWEVRENYNVVNTMQEFYHILGG